MPAVLSIGDSYESVRVIGQFWPMLATTAVGLAGMVYLAFTSFSSRQKTLLGAAALVVIILVNGIVAFMPIQTLLVNIGARTNPAMYLDI